MFADVEEPGGTGGKAKVEGFHVCGKTGTAEVTDTHGKLVEQDHLVHLVLRPTRIPVMSSCSWSRAALSAARLAPPAVGKIYQAIQKLEPRGRPTVAATVKSRNAVPGSSASTSRDLTVAATPPAATP